MIEEENDDIMQQLADHAITQIHKMYFDDTVNGQKSTLVLRMEEYV